MDSQLNSHTSGAKSASKQTSQSSANQTVIELPCQFSASSHLMTP